MAWLITLIVLIGVSERVNRAHIEMHEQRQKFSLLGTLVSADSYDGDAMAQQRTLPGHLLLGNPNEETTVLPLMRDGRQYGVVVSPIHVRGYRGNMTLIAAFDLEGSKLLGVRVAQHNETPSIGDFVDLDRSDWIKQFDGANLDSPWQMRSAGGSFDVISGATVSSRAVLRGIQRATQYHSAHRVRLYPKQKDPKEH